MITYVIDWLSCTFGLAKDLTEILPQNSGFVITDEVKCRPNYDATYRLGCGGFLSVSQREKQGNLLELSGQPLRALRNADYGMENQIALVNSARNCTRVDFALDIQGENEAWTPQAILDEYNQKRLGMKMKPDRKISNLREYGGDSIYFGGTSSDVQIRAYNKAAEMKQLWQAWTRIELQVRGRTANAFAFDLHTDGVEAGGNNWLWHKMQPLSGSWLQGVIRALGKPITLVPRKDSSFERWIAESIKPSFEKHMLIPSDRLLIEQLFHDLLDN